VDIVDRQPRRRRLLCSLSDACRSLGGLTQLSPHLLLSKTKKLGTSYRLSFLPVVDDGGAQGDVCEMRLIVTKNFCERKRFGGSREPEQAAVIPFV